MILYSRFYHIIKEQVPHGKLYRTQTTEKIQQQQKRERRAIKIIFQSNKSQSL